jgi:hypothetical protein
MAVCALSTGAGATRTSDFHAADVPSASMAINPPPYANHRPRRAAGGRLCPIVVNWLFIGQPGAGPRLSNLFTLVENCRQAGVDIEAYLIDLVTHLPAYSIRQLGDWLPRSWRRARTHGITA